MPLQEYCIVESHQQVVPGFYLMTLKAPQIAAEAKAGQFVHVKCSPTMEPLLRRPISLHHIDSRAGTITLLYQVVGRGTQLLSAFAVDDEVDVMGPLGTGFQMPKEQGQVIVVGGGIGAAPLLPLIQQLSAQGNQVEVILGARTKTMLLGEDSFRKAGATVWVATDDGSAGHHGFVTDVLQEQLANNKAIALYACGPEPMLKAVSSIAIEQGIPGQISLEERMGCGVGACLACVCKIKVTTEHGFDYKKVCLEGPVFDLKEVMWHG